MYLCICRSYQSRLLHHLTHMHTIHARNSYTRRNTLASLLSSAVHNDRLKLLFTLTFAFIRFHKNISRMHDSSLVLRLSVTLNRRTLDSRVLSVCLNVKRVDGTLSLPLRYV